MTYIILATAAYIYKRDSCSIYDAILFLCFMCLPKSVLKAC